MRYTDLSPSFSYLNLLSNFKIHSFWATKFFFDPTVHLKTLVNIYSRLRFLIGLPGYRLRLFYWVRLYQTLEYMLYVLASLNCVFTSVQNDPVVISRILFFHSSFFFLQDSQNLMSFLWRPFIYLADMSKKVCASNC